MKTTVNASKPRSQASRRNALGSYLAVTAGAAASSLQTAEAGVVVYQGPAVTIGSNGQSVYFSPIEEGTVSTLGTQAGYLSNGHIPGDRFFQRYRSADYIYTQKNESVLDMAWGTQAGGGKQVPLKLEAGVTIDASTNWFTNSWAYMNVPGWNTTQSPWAVASGQTSGYVPFSFSFFSAPADTYYGWAHYTLDKDAGTLTLNSFAYENSPNTAITTAIPEPSGLMLMVLAGSAGVLYRERNRRRRQAGAPAAALDA